MLLKRSLDVTAVALTLYFLTKECSAAAAPHLASLMEFGNEQNLPRDAGQLLGGECPSASLGALGTAQEIKPFLPHSSREDTRGAWTWPSSGGEG